MKAKKAIKRLQRVETLLATVIDKFHADGDKVHELLDAARSTVTSATEAIESSSGMSSAAADRTRRKVSTPARKGTAAAKRSDSTKANGVSNLTSTAARKSA